MAVDPGHATVGLDPGEEGGALLERCACRQTTPGRGVGEPLLLGCAGETETTPQLARGARDQGRREQRDDAQRLQAVAQHRGDRGGVTRLVQRPRLLVLDVGVGVTDEVPHRTEPARVVELLHARGERAERGGRVLDERAVGAHVGHHPVAVVHRHVEHAVGEVAEVVGEVGVVARHHRLVAEVAVGTEALVGEEVVAEAVDAELLDQVGGRDLVEARLAHLLATDEEVAVREHGLRRRLARGQQHRGPVHRVLAEDVLADEVVVRGPVAVEPLAVVGIADGGAVVDERVEPHVGDVALVPRQRDAPRDRRAADREVEQALLDQAEDLVALPCRLHRLGMLLVVRQQPVLVAREPEEVVLLGDVLDDRPVDGAALAVVELVLLVVELAAHAVEALVAVELDVAAVVDALEELLHRPLVPGLGGADVVVVGDVELVPGGAEERAVAIGPLERGGVVRLRGPLDLEPVLVGAGEEHDVVAPEPPPPGQDVGRDRRVRVPDVGRVVDVVDGRGDVERRLRRVGSGVRHGDIHPIHPGCQGRLGLRRVAAS